MKLLSDWAGRNPFKARLFLVFAHFFFGFAGFEMGLLLFAKSFVLPAGAGGLLLGLFLSAAALYPLYSKRQNYRRRKLLDGLLIGSLCLLWVFAGNRFPAQIKPASFHDFPVRESVVKARPELKMEAKTIREGSARVKYFIAKNIDRRVADYECRRFWATVGIIALGLALFLAIGYLGIAFSCSLSCAGNDAAAVIVLILTVGLEALLVWGIIRWIRKVRRKGG